MVAWTPTAIVEHHRGGVLRSWVGYQPPPEMVAELEVSRALHELRKGHPSVARGILRDVSERHPDSFVTPEAMYWEGVAAFRERRVSRAPRGTRRGSGARRGPTPGAR